MSKLTTANRDGSVPDESTTGELTDGLDRQRRWSWLLPLGLVILAVPAILPLFQTSFPATDDGMFHVSRMIELHNSLGAGTLFPRWAEPYVKGLGFPIFNFYGPIPYYLALTLGALGLTDANAFTLACAITSPAAGVAMYWWMTRLLAHAGAKGRALYIAAFGAGLAYEYAPHMLVDIHIRGGLGESVAIVLMPLLLCAIDEILWKPRLSTVPFLAITLAALPLTHNPMALLGVGTAVAYTVFRLLADHLFASAEERDRTTMSKRILYLGMAGMLGMAVSAFVWAPAMAERSYVPFIFQQMKSDYFDAAFRLQDSWPPIQGTILFDIDQTVRFRVGLIQMLLATPGLGLLIFALWRKHQSRPSSLPTPLIALLAFLTLAMIVIVFLLSPASATLWDNVSLMAAMQFPWRTLAIMAVCTSVTTGIGLWWIGQRWPKILPVIATAFAIATIGSVITTVSPSFMPSPTFDVGFIHKWTSLSGWNIPNEYIATNITADQATALTKFKVIEQSPDRLRFDVETAEAASLPLHILYFPGWTVYVDGQKTEALSPDQGLLKFSVPEGQHSVLAQFEDTPLRQATGIVSLVAGVLILSILVITAARRQPSIAAFVGMAVLAVIFIVPHLTATPNPPMEFHESTLPAENGVRLLGAGIDRPRPGVIGVTVYWQALRTLDDLESFIDLVNEHGDVIGDPGHAPLERAYVTTDWQIGEIVPDRIEIEEPNGFSSGSLLLKVGFRPYDPNHMGLPVASFELPIQGETAAIPPTDPQWKVGTSLGLESFQISTPVLCPGDDLNVKLKWQTLDQVSFDTGIFLHLVDSAGNMWSQSDGTPGPTSYPTTIWPIGERANEERNLLIPTNIPPGRYKLLIGGYRYPNLNSIPITASGQTDSQSSIVLSDIFVVPPQTRLATIQPQHQLPATFGDQIELAGFDLSDETLRPGKELVLTTYWHCPRPCSTDYTIFAQVLNSSGMLVAQSDGPPVGGGYPTSLWQTDEFVADRRTMSLPAELPEGEYHLSVGFYEWPSLNRLMVTAGGNPVGTAMDLGTLKAEQVQPQ